MATISYTDEPRTAKFGRYTGGTYVTAGETVAASDFALSRLDYLIISGGSEEGYVFSYDPSAGKVLAFEAGADGAALDEVASDTDLSGSSVDVIAVGLP